MKRKDLDIIKESYRSQLNGTAMTTPNMWEFKRILREQDFITFNEERIDSNQEDANDSWT